MCNGFGGHRDTKFSDAFDQWESIPKAINYETYLFNIKVNLNRAHGKI